MMIPAWALVLLRYAVRFKGLPRLFRPVTFSDHIMRRLVFDRDPRLTTICDKVAVKSFVAERAGDERPVPLVGAWASGAAFAAAELPEMCVVKPSFLSGPFEIVGPDSDREALARTAQGWLSDRLPQRHYSEWGYRAVPRRIMAEPFMSAPDGGQACEVDVHVFNGRAQLLRVLVGRKLTRERRDAWFDRSGRQLDIPSHKIKSHRYALAVDVCHELVEVSEAVSRDFEFMRVDCYITADGVRVGEMTPYPWGGRPDWADAAVDRQVGELFRPGADTSDFGDYRE